MLKHAKREVSNGYTDPRTAGASQRGIADTAPMLARGCIATPVDGLSELLRDAVDSRAAGIGAPALARLLQRFYDPKRVADDLQAAADHVWGQGTSIAQAYLRGQWDVAFTDEEVQGLVERAFAEMRPPGLNVRQAGVMDTWKSRIAEDLAGGATTHKASLLAKSADLAGAVLRVAVRALNVLEQDTETDRVLTTQLAQTVLVGTEFTFTNDAIAKTDPGVSDEDARNKVVEWKELVEKDKQLAADVKPKKSKWDKGEQKSAVKFTYQLGGGRTWWWALDIDPACVETQTAPASKVDLDQVEHIISRHIFGKLSELELRVDPSAEGGGGHLSLDMATLFGTSAELLLAVLAQLQEAASEEQSDPWGTHFHYVDEPNSPWLADQGVDTDRSKGAALREFTALVSRLRNDVAVGRTDIGSVAEQLMDFHTKVVNLWAIETKQKPPPKKGSGKTAGTDFAKAKKAYDKEQERADNVLTTEHRPHYQAVNVQHLVPTVKPSRRRLELRAIGAQTSHQRLAQDLSYIYGWIEQARSRVGDELYARRKTFTAQPVAVQM